MGTELRVITTGWTRELTEAAKKVLQSLDPGNDQYIYEVAASSAGIEINLEELQEIYEDCLPEVAQELGVAQQEYEFRPWDDLENEDITGLADLMNYRIDPDPQLPSLQPSGCNSAAEFIAAYGRWMTRPAADEKTPPPVKRPPVS